MTPVVIISDLHLGSPHARVRALLRFLQALPDAATLILNGDVVDSRPVAFGPDHEAVLAEIRSLSRRREVVWVRGNHDRRYTLPDPGGIRFVDTHVLRPGFFIAHGADFIALRAHDRLLVTVVRALYRLRLALGADQVHIAQYAKRFRLLYEAFCSRVRRQALAYGRRQGYGGVCCGHTHRAEDTLGGGIRYWNTGCWTEPVAHYLHVAEPSVTLERWPCG